MITDVIPLNQNMGEYFRVVNQGKMEYLDPFSMRSSEKIPSMLFSQDMSRSIALLSCNSGNFSWHQLKTKNDRTERLIGRWYGAKIDVIGDSRQEELYHLVTETFEDISLDVIALLLELDDYYLNEMVDQIGSVSTHNDLIDKLLKMDQPPVGLKQKIEFAYPEGWRP